MVLLLLLLLVLRLALVLPLDPHAAAFHSPSSSAPRSCRRERGAAAFSPFRTSFASRAAAADAPALDAEVRGDSPLGFGASAVAALPGCAIDFFPLSLTVRVEVDADADDDDGFDGEEVVGAVGMDSAACAVDDAGRDAFLGCVPPGTTRCC